MSGSSSQSCNDTNIRAEADVYKWKTMASRDYTYYLSGGRVRRESSWDRKLEDSNLIVGGWYKKHDPLTDFAWYLEHHFIYLGYGCMATRMAKGGIRYEKPELGDEWILVERPSSEDEAERIVEDCKYYAEGGHYTNYNAWTNNCEGFCHMRYHGTNFSAQVKRRRLEIAGMSAGIGGAIIGFAAGSIPGAIVGATSAAGGLGSFGHSFKK